MLAALACALLSLTACSDEDDDDDVNYGVPTSSELEGEWETMTSTNFYYLTFTGNNYSYIIMNISTKDIVHWEHGTFTIDDEGFISADASVHTDKWGSDTVNANLFQLHWENAYKTMLYVYPIGTFVKTD